MEQPTEEQAVRLYESRFWELMGYTERAYFQLHVDRLCMPFGVFHEAAEKALGRSVWTHEFGLNRQGLIDELNGDRPAPSLADIVDMIPADKRLVLAVIKE